MRIGFVDLAVLAGIAVLLTACPSAKTNGLVNESDSARTKDQNTNDQEEVGMKLTSPAFAHDSMIPQKYTCEGQDVSVPLQWNNAPKGTKSFALIVDDPDAPDPDHPKMTWVHWVLYNLPADTFSLDEGVKVLPLGTIEGLNDWKKTGYGGPCPPIGKHRYFHKLFALDVSLKDLGAATKERLETAMDGHIIGKATLVGLYKKNES